MVYLDHNATSPLRDSAKAAMMEALAEGGNASSVHAAGRRARARVEAARDHVARLVQAAPTSVVFTSGGTEANALALRGAVLGAVEAQSRITRIFVSAIEHDAVRANAKALAETVPGLRYGEIAVTADGVIDAAALRLALMSGKGRALVSLMAANNETGVVQPLAELAGIVRAEGGEDALLHVDAVQAVGRVPFSFNGLGADYATLSAHKLGGAQGAGALIVKDGAPLAGQITGGRQEKGRRSGTENVAAIAAFGAAADVADTQEMPRLRALRGRFEAELKTLGGVVIFGEGTERLPNTSNFAIAGLSAETALIALDMDGVAVSSGSACSSGKVASSHVLIAMGVERALARGAIRVSLGWDSVENDVTAIIASLKRLAERRAALAA